MSTKVYCVNKAIPFISGIAALLLLAHGCANNDPKSAKRPSKLPPAYFIGHQLTLVSDTVVEQFHFAEDGNVLACLGTKEEATGPMLQWKIINDQTLIISDGSFHHSYQFRSMTKTNAITMDGKTFRRD